jgi:hypothetical protein
MAFLLSRYVSQPAHFSIEKANIGEDNGQPEEAGF